MSAQPNLGMQPTTFENPMGIDGFEFVEFAAPDAAPLHALFQRMGFSATGKIDRRALAAMPVATDVEEVQRLLAAPTLDDALVFRDRALLELAYGAGLRVSEWITLGVRDLPEIWNERSASLIGAIARRRLVILLCCRYISTSRSGRSSSLPVTASPPRRLEA